MSTYKCRAARNVIASVLCAGLGLIALPHTAAAMQSKSFVVSWFTPAIYSQEKDCDALNPGIEGIFRNAVQNLDVSPEEKEKLFKAYEGETGGPIAENIIVNRARINGKAANAYMNPLAAPDPHMNTVHSKVAFGFNLDGKTGPSSFEEVETHEQGIDNEYFRAVGCHPGMRGNYPLRPLQAGEYQWGTVRATQSAWVITISGEDLTKDGDVTVMFERALEPAKLDALANVRADMTYRIDPSPRGHNTFKARLKNNVVETTAPLDKFSLISDPYYLPEFRFRDAQIRLKLLPNGNVDGFIGGYQPWQDPYQIFAPKGVILECCAGVDFVGLYYTLRWLADAYPDPKTGENTHISTAYRVEAVPAFAVSTTHVSRK